MKDRQIQNFTEGKIFMPLLRFALPVLAALFLQTMYGAVDLLIVGRFGGAMADVYVSAVSTGSQLMQTITVIITGLAMGLTVQVGHRIGAGRREEAGQIIGSGIILFAVMALAVTGLTIVAAPSLAGLLHAPKDAYADTVLYVRICGAGTLFIVAYNLVGSVFRGIGDSKIPLLTVFIACLLNIGGDLLLVAVFHLGAAGAAIATVLAQAVSVVLSLLVIRRRPLPFTLQRDALRPRKTLILGILRMGAPIALQDLLVSISFLVLLGIVNSLGLTASAGVGVAEKLCGFLMLVSSAFSQAMSAFVAQNIGANKPDRAKRALACGIAASLTIGLLMGLLTFFHGDLLAGIFAKDADVIYAAADYLKAYAIDCVLTAFMFCFVGYFNGCGCTTFVMVQGIVGAFGVRLPVSWIMSRQPEVTLFRIGLATPASTFVQILLCVGYFLYRNRREKRAAASA